MSPLSKLAGSARRRRGIFAALIASTVVIPVAIAFACNPQAHVSLDRTSYQSGATITVSGSYFTGNAEITVAGPTASKVVTTSPGGGFQTTLQAPSSPGNYTITASRPTGGFAPASFSVAAPAPAAEQPASETPPASAPAADPEPAFSTPTVTRSKASPANRTRPARRESSARAPAAQPSVPTNAAGQRVIAGSAPVASAPAFVTRPAQRPAPRLASGTRSAARPAPAASRAPAPAAALSDLYASYQPGRTPSLMGESAGASDGGTGSSFALGIGLLAFAFLALVSGLTAAEVRRRRPA